MRRVQAGDAQAFDTLFRRHADRLRARLVSIVRDGAWAEDLERFRRLVDGLPEAKRTVMKMVHEDEMDIATVAEELGVPEGTVKSRLHYSIKRLARELGEMD